jgi:hypothetical protein
MFQTSRQVGRIPLVLVLGECVDLTRAFLNILLTHHVFDYSVVVSTKHPHVAPLTHSQHIELPRIESSAQDSCLCCGLHGALGDALRTLFFEALNDRRKRLDRILIESDSIDTHQLAHTLKHTPFLGQRYVHQLTFRVVNVDQLLNAGLDPLKGLEPIQHDAQQCLVFMRQSELGYSAASHLAYPCAELKAWSEQIRHTLPYQKVLFVGAEKALKAVSDDDPLSAFVL